MYQEPLENLGLSPNEARLYEALIGKGESSVSGIAIAAGVHRRNAYDAIHRLIDKGLCFEIFSFGETRYNAVDPGKLNELVNERQRELEKILPELKRKFEKRTAPEEAYIYRGLEGQKNIWRDVLYSGADSYVVGAKGGWFEPRLESSRIEFFKEANRKKIKFFQLFDHEMKIRYPKFAKEFPAKLQYRFLPKEYSSHTAIDVFGDYVVMFVGVKAGELYDDPLQFVIKSRRLADGYRKFFQFMWDHCEEE